MNKSVEIFSQIVDFLKKEDLYPKINASQTSGLSSRARIQNEDFLIFGSSNYLGLSGNSTVKEHLVESLKKYGISSGATRVLGGTHDVHNELEARISTFLETESTIIFSTGYMANIGTIPVIANPLNLPGVSTRKPEKSEISIFSDEGNHGSIHDAIKLAVCKKVIFKHNDAKDLERQLSNNMSERKLIITQGVFTIDGSIAPLPELIELKDKYEAILMIDDADGIGVLGEKGQGTASYYGIPASRVDILMGSLTKAVGGFGGFISGTNEIIDYIRIAAKTNVLSAPLPPVITAAMIKSFDLIPNLSKDRDKVLNLSKDLQHSLKDLGFKLYDSNTPVVVLKIGPESKALLIASDLFANKIYAPVIRWPAVPWGESRIRFSITALHDTNDIETLVAFFRENKERYLD